VLHFSLAINPWVHRDSSKVKLTKIGLGHC